jgi:hypothetical protein
VWCEINNQGIIGPISVEGAKTNQRHLQQLQNDFIQGAVHVDTTRPHQPTDQKLTKGEVLRRALGIVPC